MVNFDRKTVNKYLLLYQAACSKYREELPPMLKMIGGENKVCEIDDGLMERRTRANGDGESEVTVKHYLGFRERAQGTDRGTARIVEIPNRERDTIVSYINRCVMPGITFFNFN